MTDEETRETEEETAEAAGKQPMDPVRRWTLIVLAVCAVLMIYYLVADRITPYTSQARVNALVIPIVSEVSGTVIDVVVERNQGVGAGELLFQVEPDRYALAVETAKANLQSARQATGASTANITAAEAQVTSAIAIRLRAEQDIVRLRRIKAEDPGAISDRRIELAEATYTAGQASVKAAEANLERARQDLGDTGDENFRVLQAQADLEQAELNLLRTSVLSPDDGVVTDVRTTSGCRPTSPRTIWAISKPETRSTSCSTPCQVKS